MHIPYSRGMALIGDETVSPARYFWNAASSIPANIAWQRRIELAVPDFRNPFDLVRQSVARFIEGLPIGGGRLFYGRPGETMHQLLFTGAGGGEGQKKCGRDTDQARDRRRSRHSSSVEDAGSAAGLVGLADLFVVEINFAEGRNLCGRNICAGRGVYSSVSDRAEDSRLGVWWNVALEATLFFSLPTWLWTVDPAWPTNNPIRFAVILAVGALGAMILCHVAPAFWSRGG